MIRTTLDDIPRGAYYILAHRSAASVMGAAVAPAKNSLGGVLWYTDHDAASAEANSWNRTMVSRNVHYTVEQKS